MRGAEVMVLAVVAVGVVCGVGFWFGAPAPLDVPASDGVDDAANGDASSDDGSGGQATAGPHGTTPLAGDAGNSTTPEGPPTRDDHRPSRVVGDFETPRPVWPSIIHWESYRGARRAGGVISGGEPLGTGQVVWFQAVGNTTSTPALFRWTTGGVPASVISVGPAGVHAHAAQDGRHLWSALTNRSFTHGAMIDNAPMDHDNAPAQGQVTIVDDEGIVWRLETPPGDPGNVTVVGSHRLSAPMTAEPVLARREPWVIGPLGDGWLVSERRGGALRLEAVATTSWTGTWYAFGHADGTVRLYDAESKASSEAQRWALALNGAVRSLAGGRVLLVGDDAGAVTGVDRASGEALWTVQTGGPVRGGIEARAVYLDDLTQPDTWAVPWKEPRYWVQAIVGSDDGKVYSINATGGTVDWTFQTEGRVRSSPAVANHTVFIGSDDGHVYAINRTTGLLVWKHDTGGPVRSSPSILNGILYIGTHDGLVALDAGWLGRQDAGG